MRHPRPLAVLLALLLAASCSGDPPEPVRVGAIYPLSGTQGMGGIDEYHGVRIAADLVNAEGGVGLGHVDLVDLHRPAADTALGVDQVGRDPDPVVLVDPAHALGAAQRVDRPDPHRLGRVAGAGGDQQQGEKDDEGAQQAHGLRSPPGGWQQRA